MHVVHSTRVPGRSEGRILSEVKKDFFLLCPGAWTTNSPAMPHVPHCLSIKKKKKKVPKYTSQGLVSHYRIAHISFPASQMNLKAWEDEWNMRIDVGTFAIPELSYPSLRFCLASIIHPLNCGFSEALNLPETVKDHLLVPFMPTRCLRQYNHACCFFLLHQQACWSCSLSHKKFSLEKGQGTASQSTWYSSADFQSVNTGNFACFDYHQEEREMETVLLLHCFPGRIKPP